MQLSRIQKFSWEDAPVRLGVGKNMVPFFFGVMPSKYWKRMQHGSLRKTRVGGKNEFPSLAQQVHPNCLLQSEGSAEPTNFGSKLLSNNGWDPFLEDPFLVAITESAITSCYATAWDFTFSTFVQLNSQ